MQISTGIVWKDNSKANANESTDLVDVYLSEIFVIANRGLLSFDIVKSFPREILLNAAVGITESNVEEYASDKSKIPHEWREKIVKTYQSALSSRHPDTGRVMYLNTRKSTPENKVYESIYNETNDYYRMLMGLPNKNDNSYIYNTDPRWSTSTPIHELDIISRLEMETAGILDELIKKYPEKEYILYLGRKCIDPFKARVADRFEILYQPYCNSDNLNKEFTHEYNNARHLALSVYYNNFYKKSNALYDNFLAMSILFMTLQSLQYKYLQVDITRDFYDTESLKLVYESYGVPFYNEIPLNYHRKIVKNINKLISYKGSSQVFFDLFNIFDLSSMDIYSYFLTKTHIFDNDGNPLFIIKKDENGNEMYDEEGNPILDDSNYKIRFSKVKIYDDPALSIADESNNILYETLTDTDPYWIEDAELIEKLNEENFNYLESKYIGIQAVMDLMKITYEIAYIFRLITDNKDITQTLEFKWADLGVTCSFYEAFIYLATLYCRYFGYQGLINQNFETIMDTLGYDFSKSIQIAKNRSNISPILLQNTELIDHIRNIGITNIDSINDSYESIIAVQQLLIDGYTNAKSLEEFYAYRDLYNTLLISKEIKDVYTDKSSGEVYETFEDALIDCSPELMQRYLLLSDDDIRNEITIVTDQLEDMIDELKYLSLSIGIASSSMIDALFKVLQFFKSAKAELANYDITYNITMRGLNFLKILDKFAYIHFNSNAGSDIIKNIDDFDSANIVVNMFKSKVDFLQLYSELKYDIRYKLTNHILSFTDMVKNVYFGKASITPDNLNSNDCVKLETINVKNIDDKMKFYEELKNISKEYIDDHIYEFMDILKYFKTNNLIDSDHYHMLDFQIGYNLSSSDEEDITISDGLFEYDNTGKFVPVT